VPGHASGAFAPWLDPTSLRTLAEFHDRFASEEDCRHHLVACQWPDGASRLLPRVHRTSSNLRTWLKGTHHGVSAKHLPHYVDEFVFRFNRRRTPMAAFQSLLGL
jgi:hypothetical protein